MRGRVLRFGVPAPVLLAAAAFLLLPSPPAWTVFRVHVAAGEPDRWLMGGLRSREECDTAARTVAYSVPDDAGRAAYVCGFDCTFLGSRPPARYCSGMGDAHEPG